MFNIGTKAAQLVLANNGNRPLIDFTVNMFAGSLETDAGGMALTQFRKGGVIVLGQPFGKDVTYWNTPLQYDFRQTRIQVAGKAGAKAEEIEAVPYVLATVMTTEMAVPNIVKRRSAKIIETLTTTSVSADVQQAVTDAGNLQRTLDILAKKEAFNRFPTFDSFQGLLTKFAASSNLPEADSQWLLASLRTATGKTFATAADYNAWFTRCRADLDLTPETRRFKSTGSATGDCVIQ